MFFKAFSGLLVTALAVSASLAAPLERGCAKAARRARSFRAAFSKVYCGILGDDLKSSGDAWRQTSTKPHAALRNLSNIQHLSTTGPPGMRADVYCHFQIGQVLCLSGGVTPFGSIDITTRKNSAENLKLTATSVNDITWARFGSAARVRVFAVAGRIKATLEKLMVKWLCSGKMRHH
ncbi:hypothetical protein C8R45DRAFT_923566 [Mycena sanguinolenta]|nr:hypothetical protein C8R45DRAFT_923566 [Mycena sanguinolenta]